MNADSAYSSFLVAHGMSEHWGAAAKTCLDGLGPDRGAGANLGFLYATEPFCEDLGSILTFLRGTTRIETWVGGIVPALCAEGEEYRQCGALGIMVGRVPDGAVTPFTALDIPNLSLQDHKAAILHADPRHPVGKSLVEEMGQQLTSLAGGMLSNLGPVYQLAGSMSAGGASGVLLGPGLDLVVDIAQGCSPIGPTHLVTHSNQNILIELDGLPALRVLVSEAGDLIARNLKRAAGYIHMGMVGPNGPEDFRVRTLIGIDPDQEMLAVGVEAHEGDKIVFVRRDANAAQTNLQTMLNRIKDRLQGRKPLAALYYSGVSRGVHMFGNAGAEQELVRHTLGDVPLLGFFGNGELANGHLYGYSGVLALLVAA